MFIRNCWYAAGLSQEITSRPLARTLLNEPVVLYRQADGNVAALEDRCCHRALPLAHGEVIGDTLQCGYHGLRFDRNGVCVKVPGQQTIPSKAKVKSYPVFEKDSLIWIWMGRPEEADTAQIINYPWHRDPSWAFKGKCNVIDTHYQLLYDNLLDLTHVGYVHKHTIGGDAESHSNAEMHTTRTENGVHVIRWLRDSNPPPTYAKAYPFKGKVDRWIEIDFTPGTVQIFAGAKDVNTGAYEGRRDDGFGLRTLHAVTPSTNSRTFYFWTVAHNFNVDQPTVTDRVFEQMDATFQEDKIILESQYQRLHQDPHRELIDIASDAGAIQARRVIAARIAREQDSATAAELA